MLLHHFLQHHAFSRIFQNLSVISAGFFKYTVRKAFKAQDVNIQDSFSRVHFHQRLLCLHGKLLRNNNIVISLRVFHGLPDYSLICKIRLSGTGTADNKL